MGVSVALDVPFGHSSYSPLGTRRLFERLDAALSEGQACRWHNDCSLDGPRRLVVCAAVRVPESVERSARPHDRESTRIIANGTAQLIAWWLAKDFLLNSVREVIAGNWRVKMSRRLKKSGKLPTTRSVNVLASILTPERLAVMVVVWLSWVGCASAATPNLVQHATWGVNGGSSETGGNTFHFSLPNASLSGNCLVFALNYHYGATRTITITDNKSNSWPSTPSISVTDGGRVETTSLWVLPNATAGTQFITVVFDASILGVQGEVSELYNIATSSPINGTTSNNGSTSPTVTAGSFTPGDNNANGGNLIYNFSACVNSQGLGPGTVPSGMTAGSGFTLLATDYNLAVQVQTNLQTTSAPINPTITVSGINGDTFNSVALALKIDTAKGTVPGPGIRIVHEAVVRPDTAGEVSPYTFGFPSNGNLLVGMLDVVASGSAWSVTTDTKSNSWTRVTTAANYVPQPWYAANATTDPALKITVTWVGITSNAEWHFYDITGAATSPFDKEAEAVANTTIGAITGAPSITPSTANGLVLATLTLGIGPADSISTPGGIFDNVSYAGELDNGTVNCGDAWQHVFNGSASAISFGWHLTKSTSWAATAVAFKAGAASPPSAPKNLQILP
jgi:hypothetical protein